MEDQKFVEDFLEDVILSKVLMNEKELLGLNEGKYFMEREEKLMNRGIFCLLEIRLVGKVWEKR